MDRNRPLDKPVLGFDLKAKPNDGAWLGYFARSIEITEPGDYEFELPIPGVDGESLRQTIRLRKSNPELDDVRTDFGQLYRLASEADLVGKLGPDQRRALMQDAPKGENVPRLFFRLSAARAIANWLEELPAKKRP
ncbi:MAG: hypothetical protein HYR84_08520 [Planctomycetes bacterium]|nr:hypothetical protein [Planctomycetota bacterium]